MKNENKQGERRTHDDGHEETQKTKERKEMQECTVMITQHHICK